MKPAESFNGQPVRSLQTMLRTVAEYNQIVPSLVSDGIYGPKTQNAVFIFQKAFGLPATGITDQATWEAIAREYDEALIYVGEVHPIEIKLDPNQTFVLGQESPYLYLAQSMLIFLAELHEPIPTPPHSGILDRETSHSIRQFQTLSQLEPTGELDRKTWMHLSKQFSLHANRPNNG